MSAGSTIAQRYGIERWGDGYFTINSSGRVSVSPGKTPAQAVELTGLAEDARAAGLQFPILLRFNGILRQRVSDLCNVFHEVARSMDYTGGYRAVYPIKVNQQRSVVEQIVAAGTDCVGLEAGSKPELMAVLAAAPAGGLIVCNGYKDREYIRLALIGRRLGHDVYIVIEKPSEIQLVLDEARAMGIDPLLGVRLRLATVATGNWQNSGGAKSKFGLSAAQLLSLIERLRLEGCLHWLQMLHSHIGSQIPDLADIRLGMSEVARYFSELFRMGVPIKVVDVGGGLGIDYEGTGTRHDCSINYGIQGYAREVIGALSRACVAEQLPPPMIFSESGRALTAHHAVLITNVVERESPSTSLPGELSAAQDPTLAAMSDLLAPDIGLSPLQIWQQANHLLAEAQERFGAGQLPLQQRALVEQVYYETLHAIKPRLQPGSRRHREVLDELKLKLAERIFCNFSLFQSLPDAWAIEQVFPVMPLQRLLEPPRVSALVHDLTCDSDGCINQYVDQDGVESTLMLHDDDDDTYLLGIFLVGAYQEILGDMHNLFGDTDAVNVEIDADGRYRLSEPERGDTVDELLRYVHFDPDAMLQSYMQKLRTNDVSEAFVDSYYRELKAGLQGTTYLSV